GRPESAVIVHRGPGMQDLNPGDGRGQLDAPDPITGARAHRVPVGRHDHGDRGVGRPLRTGDLRAVPSPEWSAEAAVTVVVAADGYPVRPRTGDRIEGIELAATVPGVQVLHAGTAVDDDGRLRSAGGRVLSITATGASLGQARQRAYQAVRLIELDGARFRTDIAAGSEP
ncbi:MAG: phosphoribosylglycinamide synthetase C domain-containing protein, partial [Actinomycetales bacterium]